MEKTGSSQDFASQRGRIWEQDTVRNIYCPTFEALEVCSSKEGPLQVSAAPSLVRGTITSIVQGVSSSGWLHAWRYLCWQGSHRGLGKDRSLRIATSNQWGHVKANVANVLIVLEHEFGFSIILEFVLSCSRKLRRNTRPWAMVGGPLALTESPVEKYPSPSTGRNS
jgi:hypothetical protein